MSGNSFCINFFFGKKKVNIQNFLDLVNRHVKRKYEIHYQNHKSEYEQGINQLKKAYKLRKKPSYFGFWVSNPRSKKQAVNPHILPAFYLSVYIDNENKYNEFNISCMMRSFHFRYCFLGNLEGTGYVSHEPFVDMELAKDSTKWLWDFFKDIVENTNCIYAYTDFEFADNNIKTVKQEDGTYKVVDKIEGSITEAVFNEMSYFSKKLLEQNNNREFILSKDVAKVVTLKNGGIIVIDHKNKLKDALLELLEDKT